MNFIPIDIYLWQASVKNDKQREMFVHIEEETALAEKTGTRFSLCLSATSTKEKTFPGSIRVSKFLLVLIVTDEK